MRADIEPADAEKQQRRLNSITPAKYLSSAILPLEDTNAVFSLFFSPVKVND
jgi:hypothetical protein